MPPERLLRQPQVSDWTDEDDVPPPELKGEDRWAWLAARAARRWSAERRQWREDHNISLEEWERITRREADESNGPR